MNALILALLLPSQSIDQQFTTTAACVEAQNKCISAPAGKIAAHNKKVKIEALTGTAECCFTSNKSKAMANGGGQTPDRIFFDDDWCFEVSVVGEPQPQRSVVQPYFNGYFEATKTKVCSGTSSVGGVTSYQACEVNGDCPAGAGNCVSANATHKQNMGIMLVCKASSGTADLRFSLVDP